MGLRILHLCISQAPQIQYITNKIHYLPLTLLLLLLRLQCQLRIHLPCLDIWEVPLFLPSHPPLSVCQFVDPVFQVPPETVSPCLFHND